MEDKKELFLEKEELNQLKTLKDTYQTNESVVASIEVKISRLNQSKPSAIMRYENSLQNLEEMESKLKDKYGEDIRVDLSTGRVIKPNG